MAFEKMSSFQQAETKGALYLVPTPIGNLEDMTIRAVKVLQEVDLIAAEDTRNTQKLLNHFEIKTPQISFHEHNTQERIPILLRKLQDGQKIAQVSDAGMPSISDPGHELVVASLAQKIPVIPLPGPNAGLTALIASGIAPQPFLFVGFLARKKKEKEAQLEALSKKTETVILYEAPHRLKKTLKALAASFGGKRQIVLCRELTKKFEEFLRGTLDEALAWAESEQIRGEFCLIIAGNQQVQQPASPESILPLADQVELLIATQGYKPNEAIKTVAKKNGLKRQSVYNSFHHIEAEQGGQARD
ncbi:16S rRNA (cytidine(1402)-2'-O)-methyltransferase [Liquorilactobacillus satsumensis]|uniref:Ribosomal RNA small subunit methyltransferase I n=1 Tax=Liquorilactobacillus satsumensis DSM 16230 = JCM 12392 TaxID=1423801 RepID=A0A0R1VB80_9LACO|nr:16S rRNA (cytidine(1402)-2'-O)-methyltransferase [Liquorilactobacillus satsumensis]KRM00227.1 Tetrapyrrole (Corrin Porphyrin) methylase family protein [Liquorilactobacillus satsumensis DSM 16230 = JCM 12392]MCC7665787.1 16S rRNA (cytidine(1402)-2'-O)-methyltransferase [Liquorilactobacillus satsumensis]MCP9313368.1 16S rRNA (cytidine(1402)-2'-O)-methyltransferase [Liquorilactobacillus satsumensis]MCP9328199.1 16S rRNA (cytidine(1402)-2'-O)-methyltransferase [Liquorilactobacillus satsumensis]